jgi:hypothetical protein
VHLSIVITFFHRVLTYSVVLLFLSSIHILKEQSSEELSYLYSYHLGFNPTNIYYKPSLCCLDLIFTGPSIHPPPSRCSQRRHPDAVDWDNREFNNKAERVKQELWVSLPHAILFNMSHSLQILEIMYGYIIFVCMISFDARLDTRLGRMWWPPDRRALHQTSPTVHLVDDLLVMIETYVCECW